MKKYKIAFITGITGQDGSYLAEFLLKKLYCTRSKEKIIFFKYTENRSSLSRYK